MTCHTYYVLQQAGFAGLNVLALAWFLKASTRCLPVLRGLLCMGILSTVLHHVVFAGMCLSISVSELISELWPEWTRSRIRAVHFFLLNQVMLRSVATHFIQRADDSRISRMAKLALVNISSLVAALALCCCWNDWDRQDIVKIYLAFGWMAQLSSLVFLYSATRSRVFAVGYAHVCASVYK